MAENRTVTRDPDLRVDSQVWAAARDLDAARKAQPYWLWYDRDCGRTSYGRWPRVAASAPYVRADIALDMMAAAVAGASGSALQAPDALAKLAEIPSAGSEERHLWLEAAEQHGFEETSGGEQIPEYDPPAYFATADEVLKLISEARKQGQRDVLAAAPATGPDGLRSTPEMRRAADEARTAHLRDVDANDQIGALTAAIEAALATGGARG